MSTTSKTYDWTNLVKESEGDAYNEKPVTYEFSGKTFKERPDQGVYQLPPQPAQPV